MGVDLFGVETRQRRAMGSHQSHSGGADQWLTPRHIVDALGPFDLDPCSPIERPWPTAAKHYTIEDDGLRQPWFGRVWLNPPYGNAGAWMRKMAEHGSGVALMFARTETAMWHDHIWPSAHSILFMRGRVTFCLSDGTPAKANAGAPSVLIAYSSSDTEALIASEIPGALVTLEGGE